MMYVTVIEWDGRVPPTRYYNRMHRLGLYVRGDADEKDPLVRRTPAHLRDSGLESIVFQEGCICCSSEQLAKAVARYARAEGAKSVQIFGVHSVESSLSPADARIFAQLEGKLGRRGRPAGERSRHVVTCLEEAMTFQIEDETLYEATCPTCKSPHIFEREGELREYAFNGDIPFFAAWVEHRFASGDFEIPNDGGRVAPSIIDSDLKITDRNAISRMRASTKLMVQVEAVRMRIGRDTARRILDGVFCALAYNGKERRRDARLVACMSLYERGVSPSEASIVENDDEIDILDASIIGPERVAGIYMTAIHEHNN